MPTYAGANGGSDVLVHPLPLLRVGGGTLVLRGVSLAVGGQHLWLWSVANAVVNPAAAGSLA